MLCHTVARCLLDHVGCARAQPERFHLGNIYLLHQAVSIHLDLGGRCNNRQPRLTASETCSGGRMKLALWWCPARHSMKHAKTHQDIAVGAWMVTLASGSPLDVSSCRVHSFSALSALPALQACV